MVRFIRSMVAHGGGRNLLPRTCSSPSWTNRNKLVAETFQMVVLAVRWTIKVAVRTAQTLGRSTLIPHEFCMTNSFTPVDTSRPSLRDRGVPRHPRTSPKDRHGSLGGCGRRGNQGLGGSTQRSFTVKKEYPPEQDYAGQEPRIGVFVSRCGVDEYSFHGGRYQHACKRVGKLPNVIYAGLNPSRAPKMHRTGLRQSVKEEYDWTHGNSKHAPQDTSSIVPGNCPTSRTQ